jgi:hypothetical protein
MMKWQARALVPVGLLVSLFFVQALFAQAGYPRSAVMGILDVVVFVIFVWAGIFSLITLARALAAGRLAFGVPAALGYAALTVLLLLLASVFLGSSLLFWQGVFVIPHMVRLDIQRLQGPEPSPGSIGPPYNRQGDQ